MCPWEPLISDETAQAFVEGRASEYHYRLATARTGNVSKVPPADAPKV